MSNKVVVVGSYNIDHTILAPKIPSPGETVIGSDFSSSPGGKGANQAVAAARAGANVTFIGKVGGDPATGQAIAGLRSEGINVDFLISDPDDSTGQAWIVVDYSGENSIVVSPGANAHLFPADIAAAKSVIAGADVLLLQLEIPLDTVFAAAKTAAEHGTTVILNPAPACALSTELLAYTDIITPNVIEAQMLTGVNGRQGSDYCTSAATLGEMCRGGAIITLGSKGAYVNYRDSKFEVPAFPADAVDSTGAGDVFNGCLAAYFTDQCDIREAVSRACAAASISVTKKGAQNSIPYFSEIEALYQQRILQ